MRFHHQRHKVDMQRIACATAGMRLVSGLTEQLPLAGTAGK